MTSTVTDRLQGLAAGIGIKAPCVVASTANLTLESTQVIDGIAVSSSQRVLVKNQSTTTENGIYTVASSTWERALDFDGARDGVPGTMVYVDRGTANGAKLFVLNSSSTAATVTVGTDSITWTSIL